ncbi:MAG: succinate dehydrogenase, cytochrome b556 subunit [Sulfuricellaceae bacterium]
MPKHRPKYLNLFTIKLPLPGVVSILHRISGVLLFLFIPFALYLLQLSLASEEGFEAAKRVLSGGFAKLVLLGLAWALLHHFFAGLRYLAMDLHFCIDLSQTRRACMAIMATSLGLTLLLGVWLW